MLHPTGVVQDTRTTNNRKTHIRHKRSFSAIINLCATTMGFVQGTRQRTSARPNITMSLPASIVLPNTPEGETVRRYALGQSDASYLAENATPIFSKDMVFNGLLFKLKGAANVVPLFADIVDNKIQEVRWDIQLSQALVLSIQTTAF